MQGNFDEMQRAHVLIPRKNKGSQRFRPRAHEIQATFARGRVTFRGLVGSERIVGSLVNPVGTEDSKRIDGSVRVINSVETGCRTSNSGTTGTRRRRPWKLCGFVPGFVVIMFSFSEALSSGWMLFCSDWSNLILNRRKVPP